MPIYAPFTHQCPMPSHSNFCVMVWISFDFPTPPSPGMSINNWGSFFPVIVSFRCQSTISNVCHWSLFNFPTSLSIIQSISSSSQLLFLPSQGSSLNSTMGITPASVDWWTFVFNVVSSFNLDDCSIWSHQLSSVVLMSIVATLISFSTLMSHITSFSGKIPCILAASTPNCPWRHYLSCLCNVLYWITSLSVIIGWVYCYKWLKNQRHNLIITHDNTCHFIFKHRIFTFQIIIIFIIDVVVPFIYNIAMCHNILTLIIKLTSCNNISILLTSILDKSLKCKIPSITFVLQFSKISPWFQQGQHRCWWVWSQFGHAKWLFFRFLALDV